MNPELLIAIFSAVILFLYGIEQFSHEIRHLAGSRFRELIQQYTRTRFHGAFLGAGITAIVQSSTAVAVITVGLVNAGTLSYISSLGIIFGANIGTTVTSQLVALKLTAFAPIFIIAGFLLSIVGRSYKPLGKPLFYFGLVFFSLNLVATVIAPYQNDPALIALFTSADNPAVAILVGFLITTLFQSSSVTTGLVVTLAAGGLITPYQAIPIILGATIGTTTTSLLVSVRMNTVAKRAATSQFMFNLFGVLIFLPFLGQFEAFIVGIGTSAAEQVALAHLLFNASTSILFLILLGPFSRLMLFLIPPTDSEIVMKPEFIPKILPESNQEGLFLIQKEIGNLLTRGAGMMHITAALHEKDRKGCQRITQMHEYCNYISSAIQDAILVISHRELTQHEAYTIAVCSRVTDLGSHLSDRIFILSKKRMKIHEKNLTFSPESFEGYGVITSLLYQNLHELSLMFPVIDDETNERMRKNDERFRLELNRLYQEYIRGLASQRNTAGSVYSEILSSGEEVSATIREIRKTWRLLTKMLPEKDLQPGSS
ncbi:MAG: Na/Pi cotransporter family protein [Methanospirillaceae archaeon]|nr:Na/Pi cotransporter family protein [Methanospirillaceae archaeon]